MTEHIHSVGPAMGDQIFLLRDVRARIKAAQREEQVVLSYLREQVSRYQLTAPDAKQFRFRDGQPILRLVTGRTSRINVNILRSRGVDVQIIAEATEVKEYVQYRIFDSADKEGDNG